jgi:ribosomal protein L25 (general stress protein Ctc)
MGNHPALAAEETVESRKQLRRLPDSLVLANMFGHEEQTLSLEVSRLALQTLAPHGAENTIVLLSVGSRTAVQVLIRHDQYNPISGKIAHLDFYVVGTSGGQTPMSDLLR